MDIILIILIVVLIFGGGFGYRTYGTGGGIGIGGILLADPGALPDLRSRQVLKNRTDGAVT